MPISFHRRRKTPREKFGGPGLEALQAWRAANGHFWRAKLLDAWEASAYPGMTPEHAQALQALRNRIGPTGLSRVNL